MTVSVDFYNKFSEHVTKGVINLATDTFKVVLLDDTYTFDATDDGYADLSGELATANGYTQNNKTLASVTYTTSGDTTTFDAADVSWTASGGQISAKYAVVFSDTSAGDKLCFCITAGAAEVAAADGFPWAITWSASGIFTIGPA